MAKKAWIIQEWDKSMFPAWRNVAGTVTYSKEEAEKLLEEFNKGEGYSSFGTNKFSLKTFYE